MVIFLLVSLGYILQPAGQVHLKQWHVENGD